MVPGTLGSSLLAHGRWQIEDDVAFDAFDTWYCATLDGEDAAILHFGSLATIAEVYLDCALVLASENMFLAHDVEIVLSGSPRAARCVSLARRLRRRQERSRAMAAPPRPARRRCVFARTLLLGHIPGWGPPVHAVGTNA